MTASLSLAGRPPVPTQPAPSWRVSLAQGAPGTAISVRLADRIRVVVCEPAPVWRPGGPAPMLVRALTAPPDAMAAAAAIEVVCGAGAVSPSVAVVDLLPDGTAMLEVRNGAPALHLAGGGVRLLPEVPGALTVPVPVVAGESLLLCSPAYLEEPPRAFGALHRAAAGGDPAAVSRLGAELLAVRHPGSVAWLRWVAPDHVQQSRTDEEVSA